DGSFTVESPGDRRRSADQVVQKALAWLTANQHKPFFCWLHLFDPHAVYLDHRETFGNRFRDQPYDAEIAYVDVQLRGLMEFLDAHRLTKKTIIVLVADHGEGLTEHRERWHGYMVYNSTMQVPLIIAGPKIYSDQRVADPVSLIDIAPTILDCLELPR